jgi:hypothetical protein
MITCGIKNILETLCKGTKIKIIPQSNKRKEYVFK